MLGLATHELYLTIIREDFNPYAPPIITCELCGKFDHHFQQCQGLPPTEVQIEFFILFLQKNIQILLQLNSSNNSMPNCEREFLFVHLNLLREHLKKELQTADLPFELDFERALDDWIFLCFFVGNDFLPHLPSLEINEG